MTSESPFVSVIIPVKNLSYYLLFENLPAYKNQKYKNFEVIVLPNEHSTYDLTLLQDNPWLRIIPTGKITRPAEKRDIGVKNAKGEIIAFIDDDAYPAEGWLQSAVQHFKNHTHSAVCGPGLLPKTGNRWEQIFDEVLKTWIGSGGYDYRFVKSSPRLVDDYPSMNFLIRKEIFEKLGGFNSDYWPGEDSKLSNDLIYKEQGKIYYHPEIAVYHHRRNTLKGFLKQHANYGFHRGAFFAHGDQNSRRIGYLAPTLFIGYLIILLPLLLILYLLHAPEIIYYIVSVPALLYLVLVFQLFILSLLHTANILIAFGAIWTLISMHFTYGIMFVKGFLTGSKNKEKIYN